MAINIQCPKTCNNDLKILKMQSKMYTGATIDTLGDCPYGCGCNCNCGRPFHKENEEIEHLFAKIYSSNYNK